MEAAGAAGGGPPMTVVKLAAGAGKRLSPAAYLA
jgi:hypothetical protein